MVVSPDGEGVNAKGKIAVVFETTCPFPKKYGSTVFYKIPKYYVTQVLAEVNAVPDGPANTCYLGCWSKSSTTFFQVTNDEQLWSRIETEIENLGAAAPRDIPKKKPESSKEIMSFLNNTFLTNNVTFVCEVQSAMARKCEHVPEEKTIQNVHKKHPAHQYQSTELLDLEGTLQAVKSNLVETYELKTPKATYLLVYLLSDLDRVRRDESDVLTGIPVFYGFAPTMDCMQSMTQFITAELEKKGLDVRTRGYDGQMFRLAVFDAESNPLTLLHTQKTLHSRVTSMKKEEVIDTLVSKCPNKTMDDLIEVLKAATTHTFHLLNAFLPRGTTKLDCVSNLDQVLALLGIKSTNDMANPTIESEQDDNLISESTNLKITASSQDEIQEHSHDVANTGEDIVSDSDSDVESESDAENGNPDIFTIEDATQELNDTIRELAYMDDTEIYVDHDVSEQRSVDQLDLDQGQSQKIEVRDDVIHQIISKLKSNTSTEGFRAKCSNARMINTNFTLVSLKTIIQVLRVEGLAISPGLKRKKDYVTQVSVLLGDRSICETSVRVSRSLSKIKKVELNSMLSLILWPQEIDRWFSHGPVPQHITVEPLNEEIHWFTQPEFDREKEKEYFNFIDPTHILTNARCHIARNGYPQLGIHREARVRVAKSKLTTLNIAFVDDIIDPRNGDTAQLFFSGGTIASQWKWNRSWLLQAHP